MNIDTDKEGVSVDEHGFIEIDDEIHADDCVARLSNNYESVDILTRGSWIFSITHSQNSIHGVSLYDRKSVSVSDVVEYHKQFDSWEVTYRDGETK
jgi:hypothetical protein